MKTYEVTVKARMLAGRDYPIVLQRTEDGWLAYLPDFGHSVCSFVGDTADEALEGLRNLTPDVVQVYLDEGIGVPKPSPDPMKDDRVQNIRELVRAASAAHAHICNTCGIYCNQHKECRFKEAKNLRKAIVKVSSQRIPTPYRP